MNSKDSISETIKVYIRQRPIIQKEDLNAISNDVLVLSDSSSGVQSISTNGKTCNYYSSQSRTKQQFSIDKYFRSDSFQQDIYETSAKPIVESTLLGYSGLILAYGPTGSGKTFTMRGGWDESRGIIPR